MELDDYHILFSKKVDLASYLNDLDGDLGKLSDLVTEKQSFGSWFETKEEMWLGHTVEGLCKSLLLHCYYVRVVQMKPSEADLTASRFLSAIDTHLDFPNYAALSTHLSLDVVYLKTRDFLPKNLCDSVRKLYDRSIWKSNVGRCIITEPEYEVCSCMYNASTVNVLRTELANLVKKQSCNRLELSRLVKREFSYIKSTNWNSLGASVPRLRRYWDEMFQSFRE